MSNLKDWIITAIGAVGGFIASLMGGWDAAVDNAGYLHVR